MGDVIQFRHWGKARAEVQAGELRLLGRSWGKTRDALQVARDWGREHPEQSIYVALPGDAKVMTGTELAEYAARRLRR